MNRQGMTPERWERIASAYEAVADLSADERGAALLDRCAGDADLQREVESLIAQDELMSPLDRAAWVAPEIRSRVEGLNVGSTFGPYRVEGALGAGGMGEVFQAVDTKLGRRVALKVLPPHFADNQERRARLEREAQLLASLNNPHIAAIHGLEDQGGVRALVLEYVEGETLAARIARGPLPLEEALPLTIQIADALQAAHNQNVVHRDLKPANIRITPAGVAKVLDFGLARLVENDEGAGQDNALTLPAVRSPEPITGPTVVLGTTAYMSPEQTKGQKTDRRSDIWAFGAVLYEMLTGRHAFAAGDVPETVAAILRAEPDWNLLPANTPEAVRRVLRRCLARNPRERLQDIGDARLDLADATAEAAQLPPASPRRGERLLWSAGVGALALALVAVGVTRSRIPPSASPAYRFEIATPATTSPMSIVLSPDARQIVYAANAASGRSQLFLRALDRTDTVPLGGTDGATFPFWSPDARSIGFFAHNELRRLDLADSRVRKLADAPIGRGGTWNAAGTILFCPAGSGTLARIPASGGEAVVLTHTLPGQLASEFPRFLRDGIHFLFFAVGPREAGGVFVGSLDGSEPRRLVDSDAAAAVSNEYVYTIHHGRLFAQRLNQDALRVDAELMPIVDQVLMDESHRAAVLSAADNGLLALRTGTPGQRRLAWFDRSDRLLDTINEPVDGSGYGAVVEISPDGRAFATTANRDLWVYDFGRRVWSRLTTDPAIDSQPVWSADSRRIAFVRVRNESADIYVRSAEPGGSDEPLVVSPELKTPGGWSPDGEYFVFGATTPLGRASIYAIRAKGDRKPFPVDAGGLPRAVHTPRLSPDGHWLAFESDEIGSGRQELYIQRFPDSGGQRKRVSVAGGVMARWARDSHSLYYVSSDGALTTVSLRSGERGDIELGTPVPLFTPRWGTTFLNANPFSNPTPFARLYDVDPDGRRFLISELVKDPSYSPITLLMNWRPSHSNAH